MGRASIKENKNVYQLKREELGLSREKASELLECVPPERIEKIDSEKVYYWSADNSRGEIDFLVQQEEKVIPIEVKAEENLQAKSLRMFVERNPGLKGCRFSMSPYREQDWLVNYPLYSVLTILGQTEE